MIRLIIDFVEHDQKAMTCNWKMEGKEPTAGETAMADSITDLLDKVSRASVKAIAPTQGTLHGEGRN